MRPRDYDGLEAQLVALGSYRFRRAADRPADQPVRARACRAPQVLDAHAALVTRLERFKCDADADLAALLRDELATAIDAYEAAKARVGALDFLDLLVRARDLVRDSARRARRVPAPLHAPLRRRVPGHRPAAGRDPAAARRRRPGRDATGARCGPRPGKLFVVGDPKQSIYRFRRADVGIYEAVREQLRAHGAACVALRSSFRAVPDIQRAVNAAFAPRMTGDAVAVQARYVPLAPVRPAQHGPAGDRRAAGAAA